MTDQIAELTEQAAATLFAETPPRPPFDPELADVAPVIAAELPRALDIGVEEAREHLASMPGAEPDDLTVGGLVRVDERVVPGPNGAPDITLLILSPAAPSGPLPGMYHTHGGGMIMGNRRSGLDFFLPYVADGSAVLVSVEYRLPPEHPDPAPAEDCYAGLGWAAEHADELGIDPEHLMIVGVSAGGGVAAGVALMVRDRGGPQLSHQVLLCPMLDDRIETVSSRMLVPGDAPWDRVENLFGWTALLGERRGGPDVSPYAAPARAEDLSGLPRTYLDVGSSEVFRDEILIYARRLSEAGVVVDLHMCGGAFHCSEPAARDAAITQATAATRAEFFRRALAERSTAGPEAVLRGRETDIYVLGAT